MQVIAVTMGFHGGTRKRVGEIFDMDETKWKKDAKGKPRCPSWVKPVTDPAKARAEAKAARQAEAARQKEGALASSGGQAAKAKVDGITELTG